MKIEFSELPDSARIWVFQASRSLSEGELEKLDNGLGSFLDQWMVHGHPLVSAYEIRYKRFIIVGIDQGQRQASGCSIDSMVQYIQQLEKEFEVDLLDKMNVSFKQGEFVAYKSLIDFKKLAKNRSVSKNTIVFNNLVATKAEYENHWEVPASESWHSRFVN